MRTLEERVVASLATPPSEFNATDFRVAGTWYPLNPATSLSTNTPGLNTLFSFPFGVRQLRTLDRIGAECTTGVATATLRIGIYSDDGGRPGVLIGDYGTIDGATTATPTPITISQALGRGVYWCAYVSQTAAAAWRAQVSPISMGRSSEATVSQNLLLTYTSQNADVTAALPAVFPIHPTDAGSQPTHVRILARAV